MDTRCVTQHMDYWDVIDPSDKACNCCPWAVGTGAAIAFGLVGMAEAIRKWEWSGMPTQAEDDMCSGCDEEMYPPFVPCHLHRT